MSLEDEINILYVALTKSKNNMIILKRKIFCFDILKYETNKFGTIYRVKIFLRFIEIKKFLYTNFGFRNSRKTNFKEKIVKEDF